MRRAVAVLALLTACSATTPTRLTTTVDPCTEVKTLWVATYAASDITVPTPFPNAAPGSIEDLTREATRRIRQRVLDRTIREQRVEQRAVLAEQHPSCFTVKERLDAETARRLLIDP